MFDLPCMKNSSFARLVWEEGVQENTGKAASPRLLARGSLRAARAKIERPVASRSEGTACNLEL